MFEVLGRFSLNCVEIRFLVTFGNDLHLCFSTFIDFCKVVDLFEG